MLSQTPGAIYMRKCVIKNRKRNLENKRRWIRENIEKVKESKKEWRRKHPEYIASRVRYFGGLLWLVLRRDNYKCVKCGMTNEEHLQKWNRKLTVDHIDGTGCNRPFNQKNNTMENLQTLCLRCHGAKDGVRQGAKWKHGELVAR